jgi:hypothetical protein
MSHPVLAIISKSEHVDQHIYPQPSFGSAALPFQLWAGELPWQTAQAHTVEVLRQVGAAWQRRAVVEKVTMRIDVTSARTVLTCRDFDKGSRWIGSPGVMLLFNALSMIAAAIRRRGRILAGQLRHEWLYDVGYYGWPPSRKAASAPGIVLGWVDDEGPAALRLTLRGGPDPRQLADVIAATAVADRLGRGIPISPWPGPSGFSTRQMGEQQTGHAAIGCAVAAR